MRRLALASCLTTGGLSLGCTAGETLDTRSGECFVDAPPEVRVGRFDNQSFSTLEDEAAVETMASPQGGFGIILYMETEGLSSEPEHEVGIEIDTLLGGERMGGFVLDGAPLRCEGEAPGFFGGMLITFDQERYVTPEDLGELDGELIDVVVRVTDEDDQAETTTTIRVVAAQ